MAGVTPCQPFSSSEGVILGACVDCGANWEEGLPTGGHAAFTQHLRLQGQLTCFGVRQNFEDLRELHLRYLTFFIPL